MMKNYLKNKIRQTVEEYLDVYFERQSIVETILKSELAVVCDYYDKTSRDFYRGCVNESRSLLQGYQTIIRVITEKVRNYIDTHECKIKQGYKIWEMSFNEEMFNDTEINFFNRLTLTIVMIQLDNGVDITKAGQLARGSCSTDTRLIDDKLDRVKIHIQCPFLNGNINEWLEGEILHEFTHAYQDFRIQCGNNKDKKRTLTNKDYADHVYSKYINFTNDTADECKRILGNIFYYLSRTEQNAYIAQMYGDLASLDYDFIRDNDTMSILVNLKTWKEFIRIREQLDILKYRYSDKPYIIKYVNELCYNKKFTSSKDALNRLNNQYKLCEIRIVKKLNNVIKQYLLDKYDGIRQIKPIGGAYNINNPNEGKWTYPSDTDKSILY